MLSEKFILSKQLRRIAIAAIGKAKTAPKAKGVDNLVYGILEKEDIKLVYEKMIEIGKRDDITFFIRDANNIQFTKFIIFIAVLDKNSPSYIKVKGLEDTKTDYINLGIAIGGCLDVINTFGCDTRVMWSIGQALKELDILKKEVSEILTLPLSLTEKNPFFDRFTT